MALDIPDDLTEKAAIMRELDGGELRANRSPMSCTPRT
jgi:hypothetical protein